jgi:glyoxylase I family protein
MSFPTSILGLDHVAITITDADRSKAFYGGFLGLEEVPRPASFDFPGAWYKTAGMTIHLVGKPAADALSSRHFCFRVNDLRAALDACKAAGLELKPAGQKIPGTGRFFIRDPDGNRIEFQGSEVEGIDALIAP